MVLSVVEIALLIMLPLVLFYQRSSWTFKEYALNIVIIYLIWYVTYALLHELSHMLGALIFDKTIFGYKLIPKFWKGDFGVGYVNYDYKSDAKDFVIILLPYLRDIIFLIIGYILLNKPRIKKPFLIGLVLVIFILSSLFDMANNYVAYLLGSMNDFNALKESSNTLVSNLIGICFFAMTSIVTVATLKKYKDYPKPKISSFTSSKSNPP